MRRGQNSLEFILLVGFLIIVFVGFTVLLEKRSTAQHAANQQALSAQLADLVEREVILASKMRNGYTRSFDLPSYLGTEPYALTLGGADNGLVCTTQYGEHIRFLSVNVILVPDALAPSSRALAGRIIVQKNESGVYFRNDCVANGKTVLTCV